MSKCRTALGGESVHRARHSAAARSSPQHSHRRTLLASTLRRIAGAFHPKATHCGTPAAVCWPTLSPCRQTRRAFSGNAEGNGAVANTVDSSTETCVPLNGAGPSERARVSSDMPSAPLRKAAAIHRQTVDFTMLVACAHELDSDWTPAKIEQVVQYDATSVCLRLRTIDSKNGFLHLCWHPSSARLNLGEAPQRGSTAEAFSYGEQLQQALGGLVLLSVRLPAAWERVVELTFGVRPGEEYTHRLLLEVQGNYSNLVLADRATILACGYQVGNLMSRKRQIQTGGTYQMPPPGPGIAPDSLPSPQEWQQTITASAERVAAQRGSEAKLSDGTVRAFLGMSPALMHELCHRVQLSPTAPVHSISPEEWARLWDSWQNWLGALQAGSFSATRDADSGRLSVIGGYSGSVEGGVQMGIATLFQKSQGAEQFGQLRQRLKRIVEQATKKLNSKLKAFRDQLDGSDKAAATQKLADIIMANVYRIPEKATEVECEDWDTGGSLLVPLDGAISASANAAQLYKKARKQRRAADNIKPLLAAAEVQLAYLEEIALAIDQLEDFATGADMDALKEIQEELVVSAIMKRPADAGLAKKAASKKRKITKRLSPGSDLDAFRNYTSPSGLLILVGHNNKQNDVLTHSVARPTDFWMHARGVAGAHVLLRVPNDRKEAVPDADFQCAADLAAWFSKARTELRQEVIKALPNDLRRPRGGALGQVIVQKETVLVGRPQSSLAATQGSAP